MNALLAEVVGTALLILFGDGVVANVLLTRSKGNDSGWIVITAGWGARRDDRRLYGRHHQRCALESGGHHRPRCDRKVRSGEGLRIHRRATAWRHDRRHARVARVSSALAAHSGSRCETRCLLHGSGIRDTAGNLDLRDHRHGSPGFRRARHSLDPQSYRGRMVDRSRPAPDGIARFCHRSLARRPNRLRHQPGTGSRSPSRACVAARSREREDRTGITRGFPSSARSSAGSSAPGSIDFSSTDLARAPRHHAIYPLPRCRHHQRAGNPLRSRRASPCRRAEGDSPDFPEARLGRTRSAGDLVLPDGGRGRGARAGAPSPARHRCHRHHQPARDKHSLGPARPESRCTTRSSGRTAAPLACAMLFGPRATPRSFKSAPD